MARLVSFKPLDSEIVYLEYSDGLEGEVDLTKTIENNYFDSLKEFDEFKKVYHNKKTNELCWPGGVRLCLNALHEKLSLTLLMKRLKIDLDDV